MSNKSYTFVTLVAVLLALLILEGNALAVQSPSFTVNNPIYDSGWLEIPDNGFGSVDHDLSARPTVFAVYIADDDDGAYPVPALDYADSATGSRITRLSCYNLKVHFGTDYLAYSKDQSKWYDRDDYYRVVIFASDSNWSVALGVPPCRP